MINGRTLSELSVTRTLRRQTSIAWFGVDSVFGRTTVSAQAAARSACQVVRSCRAQPQADLGWGVRLGSGFGLPAVPRHPTRRSQGRWKLIRYPNINHAQLFDLKSDPDETVNLATRKRLAKRVDEMTKLMVSWQKRVGDKLPLTVAKPATKEIDMTGRSRANGRRW